jgi:hypothetical protein
MGKGCREGAYIFQNCALDLNWEVEKAQDLPLHRRTSCRLAMRKTFGSIGSHDYAIVARALRQHLEI